MSLIGSSRMIEFTCPLCKGKFPAPNVLKYPYCNKDMRDKTDELTAKHIRKCAYYMNPYKYSDRGPGRPSKAEGRRHMDEVMAE